MSSTEKESAYRYLLGDISVPLESGLSDILQLAEKQMKRKGISSPTLHFRLYKQSIDARHRDNIRFLCSVLAESETPLPEEKMQREGWKRIENDRLTVSHGNTPLSHPPLVVGMGPAGLFAAWMLAKEGYKPILIDRGGTVEERVRCVENFRENGILDTNCNIQFGAGGAGTFSDGKLVTRIHDNRCRCVLETFCKFGAPEDILTRAKPHIGTDELRKVVQNMLSEIQSLGGELHYRCQLTDFSQRPDGSITAVTNQGSFSCGAMILAVGHSSRDTYLQLLKKQFLLEPKPISVGVRAEHFQSEIDKALYGNFAGHPALGHAEYSLSDTRGDRGVYSFCMCPGGEVVPAASEEGGLVVNGMSNRARDGKNANAAIAVSINPNDFETVDGSRVLGAISFQRKIEQAAFRAGGENYYAPVMTMGDFLAGKRGTEPYKVMPSYRNGKVKAADFGEIFPSYVTDGLRCSLQYFNRRISGYTDAGAVLTAAETRTSAPLRILRNAETFTAVGNDLIYPCGEGAGYAGGITSAGVDGIRVAQALMERFAPQK